MFCACKVFLSLISFLKVLNHVPLCRQWLDEAMAENQSNCPEVFLVGTKMDLCVSHLYSLDYQVFGQSTLTFLFPSFEEK